MIQPGVSFNTAQVLPKGTFAKAVEQNDARWVEAILLSGGDLNEEVDPGWDMLTLAAARGYVDVARVLIAHGARVNKPSRFGGTPIMKAAIKGHIKMMQLLVDNGADINVKNSIDSTPLLLAARQRQIEAMRFLLELGADVAPRDKSGWTVQELAEAAKHPAMLRVLHEAQVRRSHAVSVQKQQGRVGASTIVIRRRPQA